MCYSECKPIFLLLPSVLDLVSHSVLVFSSFNFVLETLSLFVGGDNWDGRV